MAKPDFGVVLLTLGFRELLLERLLLDELLRDALLERLPLVARFNALLRLPPLDRLLDALLLFGILLLELLLRAELLELPLLRPLLKLDFGGLMMLGRLLEPPLLLLALLRDGVFELRLGCRLLSALPRLPLVERLLDAPLLFPVLLRDELPERMLLSALLNPDFGVVLLTLGRRVELPLLPTELLFPRLPARPCLPVGCV